MPKRSRCTASLCTCVDFPHPSDPSNVINGSRRMMSFLRRHCACKDVFQSSKEPATFNYQTSTATDGILALEVSLDVVSLEFGIYEILLAGETGAIVVFRGRTSSWKPRQVGPACAITRREI